MFDDPVFTQGQQVRCKRNDGYHNLTTGKTYTVNKYEPPCPEDNGFTWPAYVMVHDDNGRETFAHASRFEAIA